MYTNSTTANRFLPFGQFELNDSGYVAVIFKKKKRLKSSPGSQRKIGHAYTFDFLPGLHHPLIFNLIYKSLFYKLYHLKI